MAKKLRQVGLTGEEDFPTPRDNTMANGQFKATKDYQAASQTELHRGYDAAKVTPKQTNRD